MGAALPFPFRDCDSTVGVGVQARGRLVQDQSSNWENCDECTKRADSPGELYQDSSAPARRIEGDWSTSHRKKKLLVFIVTPPCAAPVRASRFERSNVAIVDANSKSHWLAQISRYYFNLSKC